ncbi:hypothetical protein [Vibrio splendidus]|uniref:hypothetical protein n=1 Tax=Vibrio splendidus TaxID=29497 RepID=UPI000C84414F|nr:hypothetical protein [Vibrio splendidus]PMK36390.1 hypothetical protein BCU01_21735 [Vibrio splendidus]
MHKILTSILGAGLGLAGLGAVVFLGGLQGWLQLEAFASMTSEQLFYSFIFSTICTTVIALFLIVSHVKSKSKHNVSPQTINTGSGNAVTTTGDGSPVNIGSNNGVK